MLHFLKNLQQAKKICNKLMVMWRKSIYKKQCTANKSFEFSKLKFISLDSDLF